MIMYVCVASLNKVCLELRRIQGRGYAHNETWTLTLISGECVDQCFFCSFFFLKYA